MAKQNDLLMDISILYRSTQKYYDRKLASFQLTYAQLPVLILVYENEGISMQKIAVDGGYDKGTVTKNIQKLVSLGYIEVKSNLLDKRAKELYTTNKTKAIMNKIYGIRKSWWKHLSHSLPQDKMEDFSALYENMAENAKVYADVDEEDIQFFGHKKISLNDYYDKVSTNLYTSGCNFKCPHCLYSQYIFLNENQFEIPMDEIKTYLEKREKIIDAVCFMGPEPFMHPEIENFFKYVKSLGYLVKVQTNGSYPERMMDFVEKKLIDFICLDIKNSQVAYSQTIGIENFDVGNIKKSLKYLKENHVDYEIQITLIKEFHSRKELQAMAKWLNGTKKLVLTSYKGDIYHGFTKEELVEAYNLFKQYIMNVEIRKEGIE